jgi:predicted lysophospholipase L1 biosynthesis ABC-type transport system permease subunit
MEDDLRRADPDLASTMSSHPSDGTRAPASGGRLDPRRVAAGAVLAVAGLGVVLAGVAIGYSIWSILLGILGFAMMVGGVMLALHTDGGRRSRRGGGWSRFVARQEDRWDKRQDS